LKVIANKLHGCVETETDGAAIHTLELSFYILIIIIIISFFLTKIDTQQQT